jgi:hypothetical protein
MKSLWAPKPIAPKPPTPKTFTAPDGTLMVQKTDDEGTPLPGQWVPKKYRPDQEAVAQEPAPKKQNPKIVVGGREWVR